MSSSHALRRLSAARRALPRNVRALSWVSFANDAASELAYPIVPLFLTVTLGAPVAAVGLIEGVAEGIAVGLRGLSGWLSDRWGERRLPWIFARLRRAPRSAGWSSRLRLPGAGCSSAGPSTGWARARGRLRATR